MGQLPCQASEADSAWGGGQDREGPQRLQGLPPQQEAEDTTSSHHTGHCALAVGVPLQLLRREMTSTSGEQRRISSRLGSEEKSRSLSVFKATNLENSLGLCPSVLG